MSFFIPIPLQHRRCSRDNFSVRSGSTRAHFGTSWFQLFSWVGGGGTYRSETERSALKRVYYTDNFMVSFEKPYLVPGTRKWHAWRLTSQARRFVFDARQTSVEGSYAQGALIKFYRQTTACGHPTRPSGKSGERRGVRFARAYIVMTATTTTRHACYWICVNFGKSEITTFRKGSKVRTSDR